MCKITEAVAKIKGGSFIGIDTETDPKLRKTLDTGSGRVPNPDYGNVRKVNTGISGMVFSNTNSNAYENMVKRRLGDEGIDASEFKLSPRTWGTRIPETPLVTHKGKFYLEYIALKAGEVQYIKGNKPVAKSEVQGLPKAKPATQGGLENKVIIRTVEIKNITQLRVNGEVITP